MQQFLLPDPGEGLVEADIVTWRVAVGDQVAVNDIVVEVETSKSLVELPIPFAGRVAELLVSEGDLVEVGAPIIVIDDGSGSPAGPPAPDAPATAERAAGGPPAAEPERVPNLVGYGPRAGASKRRARKAPGPRAAAETEQVAETTQQLNQVFDAAVPVSRRYDEKTPLPPLRAEPVGAPLPSPDGERRDVSRPPTRVLAKPPVRKLASDLGVELSEVPGRGDGGIVTREDVLAAAEAKRSPQTARGGATGERLLSDETIPVRGVRKATAAAMVSSAFSAPHVTEWLEVDVTAMLELIAALKTHPDFDGVRVSPTLWIARATCLALQRHPALNASWDEANQQIRRHGRVNLGLAAATPRGLMVPNVKDADRLTLRELAGALNALVETAKLGRTQPADTSGGTFTITNVGVFGVDGGTPIINPGEGAILCAGAITRRPWVVGSAASERIEIRSVMTLAVSFDHRMIDGEQGSRFLADVARLLAQPALALL